MHERPKNLPILRMILAASLSFSVALSIPFTIHWPLVGDTALMHYMVFLSRAGWAPYRQFQDMNMPGSFLVEGAAMRIVGGGAVGWRIFDLSLMAAAGWAFFAIAERRRWFAALAATSLFTLIHARDGLAQGGQRDLTVAVALLCGTALLLAGLRRGSRACLLAYGALSGLAFTIKPTALLLPLIQFVTLALRSKGKPSPAIRLTLMAELGLMGWLTMPTVCLLYLLRFRALPALLLNLRGLVPYYAGLGHRAPGYILQHSLSPILPLVLLWGAVLALRFSRRIPRPTSDTGYTRALVLCGVAFGLVNCLLQGRALPYYRYPLLAFLLPLIILDLDAILEDSAQQHGTIARMQQLMTATALAFAALFLAPQSAWLIHSYRWWQLDMQSALQRTLESLGGPALSGRVQCIDTNSGCETVLYRMRLQPASGVLSDLFLFGTPTADATGIPVIRESRAQFRAALTEQPPKVIIVTAPLYLSHLDSFAKLDLWPEFYHVLQTHYALQQQWTPTRPERWWSRDEYPAAFRVYVLDHPAAAPAPPAGTNARSR